MDIESQKYFTYPYCGETISMLLEGMYGSQSYIEDCEVCCRPVQITYKVEAGVITDINADRSF